jgi:hypothetical protein
MYEGLGELEKAEEEYLKAGEDAAPAIQQEALDAVVRVRRTFEEKKRHDALLAARLLEMQERWKDAEQAYVELLKSDPAVRNEVVQALKGLRPRLTGKRWPERFDEVVGVIGRGLLVVTILLGVRIAVHETRKTRRSIQFVPFQASSDTGAKQMAFWVGRVRAELRSSAAPANLFPTLAPGLPAGSSSLAFIQMPDLPEEVKELPEFEVGGVKLPLRWLTQPVSVPRVRVSCAWVVGSVAGDAFAEVERRHWNNLRPHSTVARTVASSPGLAQDRDLRLFAYCVFIKIGSAYER